jgi:anti-anti-sigma regulatory factor
MIIKFDNDIKTDFEGYQKLVDLITKINNSTDQNIIFDFSNVFFFEANLCAVLATILEILENSGKTVKLINFNNKVETILRKNEFLIQHGYDKIFDKYATSIRYQKFDPTNKLDDNNFEIYIKQQLLSKNDFPSHSKLLGKHITLRIFELYENARTHGSCDYIHACGQYFPKKPEKPLNVTIVDTGKNFQENVSKFLNQNIAAEEAIDGGLGLDLIFQFIQHNKGKIQIISSDGFWEWHRGKSTKMRLNNPFNGTIANLRFNLNDTSHYKLIEETDDDWNNLF